MRELVTFSVEIKALPRPALVPNGHGGIRYQNGPAYQDYKRILGYAARDALPPDWVLYDGPTLFSAVFEFKRPRTVPVTEFWHTKKLDTDNLTKGAKDALTKVVWTDDGSVISDRVAKCWADEDRVTVQVHALDLTREADLRMARDLAGVDL